jgi:GNAT superfamily N-acetyltransferase
MPQTPGSTTTETPYLIKPFQWQDWYAMWQLVAFQLAESGIIVDTIQGPPDFNIPYDETDPRYPEMDMGRIDEAYLKARGNFWIAWMDDQPLGHVGAQDYGDFIELRRMYVRKEFRQRGIGTLLVKTLIEHCVENNVGIIELWTAGDGLGRPLYEKLGFRKIEAMGGEPEYAKRGSHEIRMRLVLASKNLPGVSFIPV